MAKNGARKFEDFVRMEFDGELNRPVNNKRSSTSESFCVSRKCLHQVDARKKQFDDHIRISADQLKRRLSNESLVSNQMCPTFLNSGLEELEDVLTVVLPTGTIATVPIDEQTTFHDVKCILWNREETIWRAAAFPDDVEIKQPTRSQSVPPCSKQAKNGVKRKRKRNNSWSILDFKTHPYVWRDAPKNRKKIRSFAVNDYEDYVFISPLSLDVLDNCIPDHALVCQENLFENIVKMVEIGCSRSEKTLDEAIEYVVNQPHAKLDMIASEEISQYRIAMHNCMYRTVVEREALSIDEKIAYEYPTEIDDADKLVLSTASLRNFQHNIYESENKFISALPPISTNEHELYADVVVGVGKHPPKVNADHTHAEDIQRKQSLPDYTNEVEEHMRACRCDGQKHFSWKRFRVVSKRCSKCAPVANSANEQGDLLEIDENQEYGDQYEISFNTPSYSFVRVAEDEGFRPKSARFTIWLSFEVVFSAILKRNISQIQDVELLSFMNELATVTEPIRREAPSRPKPKAIKEAEEIEPDLPEVAFGQIPHSASESSGLSRSQSVRKRVGKLFRRKSARNSKIEDSTGVATAEETEIEEEEIEEDADCRPMCRTVPLEIKTRIDNITPEELIEKVLRMFLRMIKAKLVQRLQRKDLDDFLESALSLKSAITYSDRSFAVIQDKDPVVASFLKLLKNFKLMPEKYLLQICGFDQYLVGDCSLLTFEYIRNTVSKQLSPQVLLVSKNSVIESIAPYEYILPRFIQRLSNDPEDRETFSQNFEEMILLVKNHESELVAKVLDESFKEECSLVLEEHAQQWSSLLSCFISSLRAQHDSLPRATVVSSTQSPKTKTIIEESNYATICQNATIKQKTECSTINESVSSPRISKEAAKKLEREQKFNLADPMEIDDYLEKELQKENVYTSWQMGTILRFKVILANYINISGIDQVYVQAGVYHGTTLISERLSTRMTNPFNPRWHQLLEFQQLLVSDIPLSAKLCLCVVSFSRKGRSDTNYYPVAYANLPFFDHKRRMLSDRITVHMWPVTIFEEVDEEENFLNPSGEQGPNMERYSATRLHIEFENFANVIIFPPRSEIIRSGESVVSMNSALPFSNSRAREIALRQIVGSLDPQWTPTCEQKTLIWEERYRLKRCAPDALPKLVQSVSWHHREDAREFYTILNQWPLVSIDTAFDLLQIDYADAIVREFAIRSLDTKLTDGLMMHYMLQLIQMLRKEAHHDTPLARFILRRALNNRKLGHMMFWTLKSQLDDIDVQFRFVIILEMYCRGLSDRALEGALHQLNAFQQFENALLETENENNNRKEKIVQRLRVKEVRSIIDSLYSPLNITLPLDKLLLRRCRLMDSAKKPLWLEWSNQKKLASTNRVQRNAIIFKTGDDLRQDMLTLQVIRIMDNIWRSSGLDMRMLPYDCLCTGQMVGMIQVVAHSKTVMGIQREGGWRAAHQVDNSKLLKWLKELNEENLDAVIDNFTRSCAGYCVATFVLGIGDRNPDNIMVNERGQLFHIDFGHFLGHFKSKLGFQRERVPFVLTRDFIHVITKGSTTPFKTAEFKHFKAMCFRAYLALYDHSHLLIRLFMQMMGSGIPELQLPDDIDYLRESLQIQRDRHEALGFFAAAFDSACQGTWSTKLDWFFHSIKHR